MDAKYRLVETYNASKVPLEDKNNTAVAEMAKSTVETKKIRIYKKCEHGKRSSRCRDLYIYI